MFFPGFFGNGFPMRGVFEHSYRVYPVTFLDKIHPDNGDKVVLPASALDKLASLNIDYPMLFEVSNPEMAKTSHCGVLEFTAEEGLVYMPYWMMQNLLLEEGSIVSFKSATLPKGTYVKLQPHTKDFLDISNPKAVLETTLRTFSCLTTGDNIMVAYNNKKYYIDIVETRPSDAISIIETDCEVDFAPPLDYVEPERPAPMKVPPQISGNPPQTKEIPVEDKEKPTVQAFTGSGRRLDGKPSKFTPETENGVSSGQISGPSSSSGGTKLQAEQGTAQTQATEGKLVFGSRKLGANRRTKKEAPKTEEKTDESNENSFKAFSGKGYSLKG